MEDQQPEKQPEKKAGFSKQAAMVTGLALTSLAVPSCKTKDKDPTPNPTDTTSTGNGTDSTAIKDSIAAAQKKEQMKKDSIASRERVKFGAEWGEFYGGPIATGRNPDTGQLLETDGDRSDFANYIGTLRGKFKTIAVEPAFVTRDMLPEAIARVNLTGVDPNNGTHRPLVDRLNAIENAGGSAYLKQNGQHLVRGNLQLLDFNNPQVGEAVKAYVQDIAGLYNGIFALGGGNFEQAVYENNLDTKVITAERAVLKSVSDALKAANKTLIMGDLQSVDPKAAGKADAVNNLATYVAKNCTKDLHFYDDNGALQTDKWKTYYMQQDGAKLYLTSLNKPVTEPNASALKTAIGVATDSNHYPTAPNTTDTYFTNPYGAVPKIAGISVYISPDANNLNRSTPVANLSLAGKNLRVGAEEEVKLGAAEQATPEGRLHLFGAKPEMEGTLTPVGEKIAAR